MQLLCLTSIYLPRQYNGYWGCARCLQKGKLAKSVLLATSLRFLVPKFVGVRVRLGPCSTVQIEEECPERTAKEMISYARTATTSGKSVS